MHKKIEEELFGLPENFIVLTLVKSENAERANMAMLNYLINRKGYRGNYVAISTPYASVSQMLRTNSINPESLFFIDCISKVAGNEVEASNCICIESPQNLTDLSIAIQELMNAKHGEFLLIDSINTLSIYNDRERLLKFMHFISTKIRLHELKGVMVSLHKGTDPEFLGDIAEFCDKTIDLTENGE